MCCLGPLDSSLLTFDVNLSLTYQFAILQSYAQPAASPLPLAAAQLRLVIQLIVEWGEAHERVGILLRLDRRFLETSAGKTLLNWCGEIV